MRRPLAVAPAALALAFTAAWPLDAATTWSLRPWITISGGHLPHTAADLAINSISAVRSLLKILCSNTGMRFAAVARVSEGTWTACTVQDDISFGLGPGGQLDVQTTLCIEARAARAPVVIDHASQDPVYENHHTPRRYKIESYISVPIIRGDGTYFGNLCAIDPNPRVVSDAKTVRCSTASPN